MKIPSHESWTQALLKLRPRGFAWPRGTDSVQAGVFRGIAGILYEFWAFALIAVQQWLPSKTCSRIDDWERALGLPDPCVGYQIQSLEDRRLAIIGKFGGISGLAYGDSSPAALGSMEKMVLAATGVEIKLAVGLPTAQKMKVGDPIGSHLVEFVKSKGILHVTPVGYRPDCNVSHRMKVGDPVGSQLLRHEHIPGVNQNKLTCRPMRVGDRVGSHLVTCTIPSVMCYLHRIAPARYMIKLHLPVCPSNT